MALHAGSVPLQAGAVSLQVDSVALQAVDVLSGAGGCKQVGLQVSVAEAGI